MKAAVAASDIVHYNNRAWNWPEHESPILLARKCWNWWKALLPTAATCTSGSKVGSRRTPKPQINDFGLSVTPPNVCMRPNIETFLHCFSINPWEKKELLLPPVHTEVAENLPYWRQGPPKPWGHSVLVPYPHVKLFRGMEWDWAILCSLEKSCLQPLSSWMFFQGQR